MEELPTDEMGDLSFELWESENVNGTVTHSTQEAKDWIAENFDDLVCIEVTSTLLYKAQEDGEEMTVERLKESLKRL